MLNPGLSVWINEKWVKVYELMNMEEVRIPTPEERKTWLCNYWVRLQEEADPRFTRKEAYDEYGYYDWLDDEDEPGYYSGIDVDDEDEDYVGRDDKPDSVIEDINAFIEEHYHELFSEESDSEEGFRRKLYRVIRKMRMANTEIQEEADAMQEEADAMGEGADTMQEEADTMGEEKDQKKENPPQQRQKNEATQFRLPFDD